MRKLFNSDTFLSFKYMGIYFDKSNEMINESTLLFAFSINILKRQLVCPNTSWLQAKYQFYH